MKKWPKIVLGIVITAAIITIIYMVIQKDSKYTPYTPPSGPPYTPPSTPTISADDEVYLRYINSNFGQIINDPNTTPIMKKMASDLIAVGPQVLNLYKSQVKNIKEFVTNVPNNPNRADIIVPVYHQTGRLAELFLVTEKNVTQELLECVRAKISKLSDMNFNTIVTAIDECKN